MSADAETVIPEPAPAPNGAVQANFLAPAIVPPSDEMDWLMVHIAGTNQQLQIRRPVAELDAALDEYRKGGPLALMDTGGERMTIFPNAMVYVIYRMTTAAFGQMVLANEAKKASDLAEAEAQALREKISRGTA